MTEKATKPPKKNLNKQKQQKLFQKINSVANFPLNTFQGSNDKPHR